LRNGAVHNAGENATQATAPMYIVNPFRNKLNVNNLTSTHPPLAERIASCARWREARLRQLRQAYRQVKNTQSGIISPKPQQLQAQLVYAQAVAGRTGRTFSG